MFEYAKDQLLKSTSNADLLMRAELLIEEDWLGDCDVMNGNIYRIAAFGDFFPHDESWCSLDMLTAMARAVGCFAVFVTQISGPPLIFMSAAFGYGRLEDKFYRWDNWRFVNPDTDVSPLDDWKHIVPTKCLGLVLMFAFLLNALFVCLNEKNSWKEIYMMFKYLGNHADKAGPGFKIRGGNFLYLGGAVNTWLCFWLSMCAFVVIGPSRSPKDLIMDSLGLLFLYNLDDLDGDLGFVTDDDWPGLRLKWIYLNIVQPEEWAGNIPMSLKGRFTLFCYNCTCFVVAICVVAMPTVAIFTPFNKIAPQN